MSFPSYPPNQGHRPTVNTPLMRSAFEVSTAIHHYIMERKAASKWGRTKTEDSLLYALEILAPLLVTACEHIDQLERERVGK